MALYPAPDMRTGAISIWVAGAEEAERAVDDRSRARPRRRRGRRPAAHDPLRARRVAARVAHAAAGQVDLPPGRDRRGDGRGRDRGRATTSTRPTPARPSPRCGPSAPTVEGDPAELRIGGVGLRGARGAPIDVGNAGTLLAAAARLARGTARRGVDARRRRVDPPAAGRPRASSRCARWAPTVEARDGSAAADERPGRGAARDRVPAPGRERAGEVVPAARGHCRRGPDQRDRAPPDPRSHRAHAARRRGDGPRRGRRHPGDRPRRPAREAGRRSSPPTRLEPGEITVPADFSSAAFFIVAAALVRGSEVRLEGVGHQPRADRAARDPHPDGRRASR